MRVRHSSFALSILALALAGCSAHGESACLDGQRLCDGVCVSTATDPGHCGACGNACPAERVCSQGTCAESCTGGLVQCGRTCVDTDLDARNCGRCGNACAAGALCEGGKCSEKASICTSRLPLMMSGAYDADLKTVQVTGRLMKNGGPVPRAPVAAARGSLVFVSTRHGQQATPLPDEGDAAFQIELFADTYEVYYQPHASCRPGGPLPCQRVLLRAAFPIMHSGALDFDARTVSVSGKLTKNGTYVPQGAYRGSLSFSHEQGSALATEPFPNEGQATYQAELFAGTYDVSYLPHPSCWRGGPMPCQRVLLRGKQAITQPGVLDFDATTVSVSGKLTKNGADIPQGAYRGQLSFSLQTGSALATEPFPNEGQATYQAELFAGTYDVSYLPHPSCWRGGPMPCQRVLLRSGFPIMQAGVLDFDATTVSVSGKLTKNGADIPQGAYRGQLSFSLQTGSALATEPFTEQGQATYQAELFTGTYDVHYVPHTSCRPKGPLPCQRVLLRGKQAITQPGVLDFDATTVLVSGKLTKNGADIPQGAYRGQLSFSLQTGSALATEPFTEQGRATYQAELFTGTYDVHYVPHASCRPKGPLPCQQVLLRGKQAITQPGVLDFDARTVIVSGRITKNGQPVPQGAYRGLLSFSLHNGTPLATEPFSDDGHATYQTELFAGSYDVYYKPHLSCRPKGPLPCQGTLVAGCAPEKPE